MRSLRSARPLRALLVMLSAAAIGVMPTVLAAPTRAAGPAVTCDTTYTGADHGAFNAPANWSNGAPVATTNACIPYPRIARVGPGNGVTGGLAIGGTLEVMGLASSVTLTINGDASIGEDGTLLIQGATANATTTVEELGTLTNEGTIQAASTASGTHQLLKGNVVNHQRILASAELLVQSSSAGASTLDNQGTIQPSNGSWVTVSGSATVLNHATIDGSAGGGNEVRAVSGGTFEEAPGGYTYGTEAVVADDDGILRIGGTSGPFFAVMRGRSTLQGTIGGAHTVTVQSIGATPEAAEHPAHVTWTTGCINEGTLVLQSVNSPSDVSVTTADELVNYRLLRVDASAGGARSIIGPSLNNTNIIDLTSGSRLDVQGDFTQIPQIAQVQTTIRGADSLGRLVVSGTANLAAILTATLGSRYFPAPATIFPVLTAATIQGTFAGIQGPGPGWIASYTQTEMRLTAASEDSDTTLGQGTPNPSDPSQAVSFDATVTTSGASAVTGSVALYEEGAPDSLVDTRAIDTNGHATFTAPFSTPGAHRLYAAYGGDSTHVGSASATVEQRVKVDTQTSLLSSPNPSLAGQNVTFTATVTPSATGGPGLSGTVDFREGTQSLGSAPIGSDGVATWQTGALVQGSHTITAVYSGDSTYEGSSSTGLTQQVGGGAATVQDSNPAVQYNGWTGVLDAAASGGSYRTSNTTGDQATFKFTGTSFTLVTRKAPQMGKVQVLVNGVSKGTFDLYSPTVVSAFSIRITGLTNVAHPVVVKVTGQKNAASTGTWVAVDAFRVGTTTTEETATAVGYTSWTGVAAVAANGGTYRVSPKANAKATFRFTGTSIDWITVLGPSFGRATVTIDGVGRGTFDQFRSGTQYKVARHFGGLSAGSHTIVITVLGQKSAAATGTKVAVDAFVSS